MCQRTLARGCAKLSSIQASTSVGADQYIGRAKTDEGGQDQNHAQGFDAVACYRVGPQLKTGEKGKRDKQRAEAQTQKAANRSYMADLNILLSCWSVRRAVVNIRQFECLCVTAKIGSPIKPQEANLEATLSHRLNPPDVGTCEPSQAEVVSWLGDPATHGGRAVTRIDTPISHVFVTGPRTYKLKRAVNRNFVDYSTLAKRKALCEREVEVNIVNAPRIYKGVLAITRTIHGFHFGGADGEAVDYVVEMDTFDPNLAFDRLAETGTLEIVHMRQLADLIARMHAAALIVENGGGAGIVGQTLLQIAEAILEAPVGDALVSEVSAWQAAADAALAVHASRIDVRRRHGFVRRCHGDLHLGNLCLFEGAPTPFDAIEFSEEIASIDVLYDLAFAVMDLLHRGLRQHANVLVSRYLNITRDYSGVALMPLFVSLRAAVRAMVAASNEDAELGRREALGRLEFALRILGPGPRPQLIAVGGLSGSGKSTVAQSIAPELPGLCGGVVIRSDVCRKRLFKAAPEEPLPLEAYAPEVSARVYRIMQRDAARALRAGVSVILDATFIDGDEGHSLERIAESAGASFTGLWLSLDLDVLQARIERRGSDASDATPAVAATQWARVQVDPAWTEIDAGSTPEEVAARALQALPTGAERPA